MGGVNDEEEGMLKWCGNDNNDKVAQCLLMTASSSDINTIGTIRVSRLEMIHYV